MLRISLRESSEETYLDSFMLDDEQDSGRNDHLPWFIDTTTPTTWTKAQVRRRVTCLALSLQAEFQLGLDHSDSRTPRGYLNEVVAFISPNDIDYAVCVWAVHRLGCAVACCNGTGTSSELAHQFRLAKPTLLVVHPSALDHAVAAAVAYGISSERVVVLSRTSICSERLTTEALINRGEHLVTVGAPIQRAPSHGLDPVAFLCFSSGTTGLPKAVLVPHRAVIANVLQVRDSSIPRVRAAPGDRALGVIPFSHMYGLLMLVHVCPSLGIATVVYPSLPRPFDSFLASLTTHRVNHLFLAPPLVHAFVKHPASATSVFSHFKTALVAAAPLNGLTEDTFRRMCPEGFLIAQVFGMTETAGIITAVPEGGAPRAGSVGHMITATEGKVVTEDGAIVRFSRESPPDVAVRGELRARGPELCLGYLDNDLATAEAFDEEGYIRTGDIVEVTKDGNVTIVDRAKHIIKSKGFQVSPAELEGHLLQCEYVQDAGVTGVEDERAGERPVALVVLSPKGKEEAASNALFVQQAIMNHVERSKSEYKWLAAVYFADTIPKLPSGKILVRELKAMVAEARAAPHSAQPLSLPHAAPATVTRSISVKPSVESSMVSEKILHSHLPAGVLGESKPVPSSTLSKNEVSGARQAPEKRSERAATRTEQILEWISLYRIFHGIILIVNVVGIGFTISHRWDIGRSHVATFALANILASLLARNELFLRCLYSACLILFSRWPPLWWRECVASFLLNIGGLHSGFAVAGTFWVVAAVTEFFRQGPRVIHPSILALAVVALTVLVFVCASAWPSLRQTHHNAFENVHRLAGWTGLAFLWVLVGLADSWEATTPRHFSKSRLARQADIYIVTVITILIALPWMTLRKIPVEPRVLSRSVVQLRFRGRGYRVGIFGRIARHPLRENHAFGISSLGPNAAEHSMFVVGQGDFTRGLIEHPPTHVYTRMYKFVGLPYIVSMYRRGLYVITGTAIGVALSVFLQPHPRSRWHLLWVASRIEDTYRDTALADLKSVYAQRRAGERFEDEVTIWDTRERGRPNLMALVEEKARAMDAEVVFVTSNPQGTSEILRGCRQRGIPAHGPVWDS